MNSVVQAKPDGHMLGGLWNVPLTMTPHTQSVPYSSGDYVAISLADVGPKGIAPDRVAIPEKAFVQAASRGSLFNRRAHPIV